jgi:hypothetical protein
MKEIYAESGILAVAYERPYGEFSRLLQYSMSYLTSGAQVSTKIDSFKLALCRETSGSTTLNCKKRVLTSF